MGQQIIYQGEGWTVTQDPAFSGNPDLANQPETWLAIPGYEGIYEASTEGRIRSLDRLVEHGLRNAKRKVKGRVLKANPGNHGYPAVNLYKEGTAKFICVHRLIMLTFVGPCPEGLEVAHSDGNRLNARIGNLRYATRSENMQDAIRHGTAPVGYRCGQAKLTREQVSAIRMDTRVQRVIAKDYGVSDGAICLIKKNKTYKT
jgi:hypothetical protein